MRFDPFTDDEAAPAIEADPVPDAAASPAGHDPFAAANAPTTPVIQAPQPATPVIKQYTVVRHPVNGLGLVIAAGVVGGLNAVMVGWFESVSGPLTTDQLELVSSS